MTRLVVAEKRSVGVVIAKHLGATQRGAGYLEGNGNIVTWCQGHLVELCLPSEYEGKGWDSWDRAVLPMIPDVWRWKPGKVRDKSGRQANNPQLKVVCDLMRRSDVDVVVNACDPDREGEGIFRRVATWARLDKPVMRLWSSSLTDKALRAAFDGMGDAASYDGLGNAAELRAKEDWLVGMNGSKLYRRSVGRVRTPTLRFVVDRDRAVEGFVSKPFWQVVCDLGDGLVVKSRKYEDEDAARELADACIGAMAQVTDVSRKRARVAAPLPFNTTAAQKEASKVLGMTPSETDEALQRLYEQKVGSYPRTSSRHITAADERDVREVIATISGIDELRDVVAGIPDKGPDTRRIVNDAKVEGHTALLPTELLDAKHLEMLDEGDRKVILMVAIRLLQSTMPDGEKSVSRLACTIADEEFVARGESMLVMGWTSTEEAKARALGIRRKERATTDDADGHDTNVPAGIAQGDVRPVRAVDITQGKTTPPARFTDATLLEAMEHASRYVDGKEMKAALGGTEVHAGGLGTDATRGSIIKALVAKGLIRRTGGKLVSTEDGRAIIDAVGESLKSPVLTAEMEMRLTEVTHGQLAPDDCLREVEAFVRRFVAEAPADAGRPRQASVGTCPLCGGKVLHSGRSYRCENARREKGKDGEWHDVGSCRYSFPETIASRKVSEEEARKLLAGERLRLSGFVSRKGKKFSAELDLDPGDGYRPTLHFDDKPRESSGTSRRRQGT